MNFVLVAFVVSISLALTPEEIIENTKRMVEIREVNTFKSTSNLKSSVQGRIVCMRVLLCRMWQVWKCVQWQ